MLNQEQMAVLPPGMAERLNILEKLFEHPGWKFFKAWATANATEAGQLVIFSQKWEDHCYHRGRMVALESVANYEAYVENEAAGVAKSVQDEVLEELEDNSNTVVLNTDNG